MTLIEDADYFIRYLELPPGIYAFVTPNDDGTYSIYLDPRRDPEHQRSDCAHEVMHIIRGDLYDTAKTATEIENEMQKMQTGYN